MIDDYLREFEMHLVGSALQKAEWSAELRAHLEEAAADGDLMDALERLGTAREAAAAFQAGARPHAAELNRRFAATLIDHVPLVVVCVAIFVEGAATNETVSLMFPPPPAFGEIYSVFRNVATALGLLWSFVGLAMIEERNGRTPGKALLHLRAISADGTKLNRSQAFRRRIPILLGPLVWADVAAAFFTARRQRVFDLFTSTMVIDDRPPATIRRMSDGHSPRVGA